MEPTAPLPAFDDNASAAPSAPPGWYPDPMRRFELRYFNGQQWTADVSNGGQRMIDNGGAVAAPHAWGQGVPAARPPGRGFAVAAFVLSLAALLTGWVPFVFVLAAGAAIAAIVFAIIGIRKARANGGRGMGLSVAALVLAPIALGVCVLGFLLTRTVLREVTKFIEPGRYELVEQQPCTIDDGVVSFRGTITNTDTDEQAYTLTIEFTDADPSRVGRRLTTDQLAIPEIAAGATYEWESVQLVAPTSAVSCEVTAVYGPAPFGLDGEQFISPN